MEKTKVTRVLIPKIAKGMQMRKIHLAPTATMTKPNPSLITSPAMTIGMACKGKLVSLFNACLCHKVVSALLITVNSESKVSKAYFHMQWAKMKQEWEAQHFFVGKCSTLIGRHLKCCFRAMLLELCVRTLEPCFQIY